MRAGLRGAGLKPDEFWQLTPLELMVLLGREAGQAPITRSRLEELAAAYPDKNGEASDG